jgi:hypothetical protein
MAMKKRTPTEHQLGDQPIQEDLRGSMQAVAKALDEIFNGDLKGEDRKVGFVLLTFNYGEDEGRCNYISNGADRKEIVTLLKEQIKRFEGAPDVKGNG